MAVRARRIQYSYNLCVFWVSQDNGPAMNAGFVVLDKDGSHRTGGRNGEVLWERRDIRGGSPGFQLGPGI